MVMTPEFAAPEQIRGTPISTATDVYALGVLLYQILTGGRPYDLRGKSPAEVERIVCVEAPPRPSSRAPAPLARRLRGDLDLIVLTALQKDAGAALPVAGGAGGGPAALPGGPPHPRAAGQRALSAGQVREPEPDDRRARRGHGPRARRGDGDLAGAAQGGADPAAGGAPRGAAGDGDDRPPERVRRRQPRCRWAGRSRPRAGSPSPSGWSCRATGASRGSRPASSPTSPRATTRPAIPGPSARCWAGREPSRSRPRRTTSSRWPTAAGRSATGWRTSSIRRGSTWTRRRRRSPGRRGGTRASRWSAWRRRASCSRRRGSPDSGIALLERAVAIAGTTPGDAQRLGLTNSLAEVLRLSGRTREAVPYFRRILADLEAAGFGDTEAFPNVVGFLAVSLWDLGEIAALDSTMREFIRSGKRCTARGGSLPRSPFTMAGRSSGSARWTPPTLWIGRAASDTTQAANNFRPYRRRRLGGVAAGAGAAGRGAGRGEPLPDERRGQRATAAMLRARVRAAEGDSAGAAALLEREMATLLSDGQPGLTLFALPLVTAGEWRLARGDAAGADSLARLARSAAAIDSVALGRSALVGRAELLMARSLDMQARMDEARERTGTGRDSAGKRLSQRACGGRKQASLWIPRINRPPGHGATGSRCHNRAIA